jgi:peptide deformylase
LSYPGLTLNIERPRHLRLRYQDTKGETHTATFANLTARCVLHEIDHLDGVVFTEKVSKLKLDMAVKKAKKHSGKIYSTSLTS